jgi:hypothetical protein
MWIANAEGCRNFYEGKRIDVIGIRGVAAMQRYKNVQGSSGVVAFELRPRSVVVQFQDGYKYEYTSESAGASTIAEMKKLALSGRGLSTFISQRVRERYARKYH